MLYNIYQTQHTDMENTTIDLDIRNYSVEDLLNLFTLQYNFNQDDLKRAYKQTLMMHPDKSNLDKEYFLFFSKAFKKVKYLYDYRNKSTNDKKCAHTSSTIYNEVLNNTPSNNVDDTSKIIETLKKDPNFNQVFNEAFEKVRIYDDEQDAGYDEWIENTSHNNEDAEHITNTRSLHEYIEKKKKEVRAIVQYNGIQELDSSMSMGNNSNLRRQKPTYYESGLFSKMQYDDYKRAHSETVIPVTEEDYLQKEKYNTVNELMKQRTITEAIPSLEQSTSQLNTHKKNETIESMEIAYDLARQMEQIEKSQKLWKGHFNLLTYVQKD